MKHGVPQSSPRIYIIGIRRDCQFSEFVFPEPLPLVSIESFLDPVQRQPTMQDLPPKSSATAYNSVDQALKKLTDSGEEPLKNAFVVDCDSSVGFGSVGKDKVMCMTKSRASGHWITSRGCRMNLDEMLRCQGMERSFKQVVSNRVLGAQIGNAMSQNVIERLLTRLLPAAGLVSQDCHLVDRWALSVKQADYKRKVFSQIASSPTKRARKA